MILNLAVDRPGYDVIAMININILCDLALTFRVSPLLPDLG